jgi:hypothetical protein
MNRRGFLRGAISVMAVAAIIKGRNTITSSHGHELDLDTGVVGSGYCQEVGTVHVEGNITTYFENTELYEAVVNGIADVQPMPNYITTVAIAPSDFPPHDVRFEKANYLTMTAEGALRG